jgi:hypothetical protein
MVRLNEGGIPLTVLPNRLAPARESGGSKCGLVRLEREPLEP